MKPARQAALVALLEDVLADEPPPVDLSALPDVQELTKDEVETLLRRRHDWAVDNILALGGYKHGREYRFPVHAIKSWQLRQAEAYAQQRRAS